ncbi:CPBP family intramembrane glutamic endopeptidase [Lacipirellula parvula]|uniref:CAAX prenyl protease 2/Lysostaphin resistance protein A-like domain-containing protein n=1 Tax=Lacipirellula parvula TaxID=2650471 RepID=A0A5K7X5C1_9BACT|nr:CPBP family intramembrane glutamic endopeptidase [Lacipirellula parvula]BBO31728.1 hypothetical protein PLANPX_1340 [Lacipirellula parvula]
MDKIDGDADAVSEPVVVYVECWRCALPAAVDSPECPHCFARPQAARRRPFARVEPSRDEFWQLKTLFISYGMMLAIGILHAVLFEQRFGDVDHLTADMQWEAWLQVACIELVDTLLVLGTYFTLRRSDQPPAAPEALSFWIWPASLPMLVGMLVLNLGYHALLRDVIGIISIEDELTQSPSWLAFFAICVQPAIVEELYCRGLVFRVLRPVAGTHGIVWISALMFGLMHVAAMLSIPYLILFGAFVGYMRLKSGAVWLPMVLHFLHNLAVMLYEWNF